MANLNNLGMSRVFFSLASGKTTLKEIANQNGISPPATIEQIHRLERLGLVLKGPKQGKYRPYDVDWAQAAKITAENLPALKEKIEKSEEDPKLDVSEKQKLLHMSERLGQNEPFVRMVKTYFEDMGKIYWEQTPPKIPTLAKAVSEFEEALSDEAGKWKSTGPSAESRSIEELWDIIIVSHAFTENPVISDALRAAGFSEEQISVQVVRGAESEGASTS